MIDNDKKKQMKKMGIKLPTKGRFSKIQKVVVSQQAVITKINNQVRQSNIHDKEERINNKIAD